MEVVDRADQEASSRVNFPLNSQSYKLLTELSRSGPRVVVYRAECIPLNSSELVAIKTIDFDGRSAQSLIDLIRSANILTSSLSHPNLASAHCSFIAEDYCYWIVMPFLPSGSVRSAMSEFGHEEEVISVVLREVLKGLVYLHGQGKFHGDIKTGNILLGSNGSVMLADYGDSESCYDPDSGRFRPPSLDTSTGDDVPYWVAPEKEYSSESDIWTVGIVALEMGCGRPPLSRLPGTESIILRLRKRFGSWKYERTLVRKVWSFSEEYVDMVSLCLDQDPAKRPSAQDLLKHPFFLKYDTMASAVIKEHLVQVQGFSPYERGNDNEGEKNDDDDDKVPNYLLTGQRGGPISFATAWKFNEGRILLEPELETLTRTDSLVRRIDEWKLNAVTADMEAEIGGETSSSSEVGADKERQSGGTSPKALMSRAEEMAEEIRALKVALEIEQKRRFELEDSIETLENLITHDFRF